MVAALLKGRLVEASEEASLRGDLKTSLGRRRRSRLVRSVRARVAALAVAAHPAAEALGDAPDEVREGFGGRRSEGHERNAGTALGKHAVGGDDMKMDVQVERAAEALHERDGAALAGDLAPLAGLPPLQGDDFFDEQAAGGEKGGGVPGDEKPEREGQREDPLSHGHVGENAVDEVRRRVCHAPAAAARAQASVLAREGDEAVFAAGVAMQAHEAVFEQATAQVLVEFVHDVARQPFAGFARFVDKRRPVIAHESIKKRCFWSMALVAPPPVARAGRIVGGSSPGPPRRKGHGRPAPATPWPTPRELREALRKVTCAASRRHPARASPGGRETCALSGLGSEVARHQGKRPLRSGGVHQAS